MLENKKKTVGALARELMLKDTYPTHTVKDQTDEQLTDYEKNVYHCIEENKSKIIGDFYVVVLTKREKLLKNVIRSYFAARISCPTPNYDQVVYKYHAMDARIEFLWVIPDREISKHMKAHSTSVDPSQWELLSYILKFADGSLFRLAKELNGEKEKTPELKDKYGK